MKLACILAWIIAATAMGTAQEKASTGDFTKSPTEHIINQMEQPSVVRSIQGIIIRKEGLREPLADVLFEIQGPGADKKIRKGTTDQQGRFKIARVPTGTYKFKATLNGFQSVMGTVIVSPKATPAGEIKVEMPVGV